MCIQVKEWKKALESWKDPLLFPFLLFKALLRKGEEEEERERERERERGREERSVKRTTIPEPLSK